MSDEDFMRQALAEAEAAAQSGEVPVGAVVVRHGQVIARARNAPIGTHDPTAHAEIVALRAAAQTLGNYRLDDCELFVTLEPCAMCSGALLHARFRRVVFGAPDPKTGAAGSVLNLYGEPRLNHQTVVTGGVLAEACGELLRRFFQQRRHEQRQRAQPLRDDALRTPEARFNALPDHPWVHRQVSSLPALSGWRLSYIDEGPEDAPLTWLCLHGSPGWSHQFRCLIPVLLARGGRVVAPDLIGFGQSDKPKKEGVHTFGWHRRVLLELVESLDLQRTVLVAHQWGGLLGLTLPMAAPQRYQGLLALGTGLTPIRGTQPVMDAADQAPFPDPGHQAALRAFPSLLPKEPDGDEAHCLRQAQAFWQQGWQGRSLVVTGQQDPAWGIALVDRLWRDVHDQATPLRVPGNGTSRLDEHGAAIAQAATDFFAR